MMWDGGRRDQDRRRPACFPAALVAIYTVRTLVGENAMYRFVAALALAALSLSSCAKPEPAYRGELPPFPPAIGPAPSAESPEPGETDNTTQEKKLNRVRSRGSAGTQPDLPTVSPLAPRPPLYELGTPALPPAAGGAAPNLGPVTGYGPGGMAIAPGSPANPPYR
jgi:hypothetical protein